MLRALGTGANLTTGVQVAAYAVEYNGEVFSNDADFGRFEGVPWVNPLTVPPQFAPGPGRPRVER